jgi:hypothetical protein
MYFYYSFCKVRRIYFIAGTVHKSVMSLLPLKIKVRLMTSPFCLCIPLVSVKTSEIFMDFNAKAMPLNMT